MKKHAPFFHPALSDVKWHRFIAAEGAFIKTPAKDRIYELVTSAIYSLRKYWLCEIELHPASSNKLSEGFFMELDLETKVLNLKPTKVIQFMAQHADVETAQKAFEACLDGDLRVYFFAEHIKSAPNLRGYFESFWNAINPQIQELSCDVFFGGLPSDHPNALRGAFEFSRQFWQYVYWGETTEGIMASQLARALNVKYQLLKDYFDHLLGLLSSQPHTSPAGAMDEIVKFGRATQTKNNMGWMNGPLMTDAAAQQIIYAYGDIRSNTSLLPALPFADSGLLHHSKREIVHAAQLMIEHYETLKVVNPEAFISKRGDEQSRGLLNLIFGQINFFVEIDAQDRAAYESLVRKTPSMKSWENKHRGDKFFLCRHDDWSDEEKTVHEKYLSIAMA